MPLQRAPTVHAQALAHGVIRVGLAVVAPRAPLQEHRAAFRGYLFAAQFPFSMPYNHQLKQFHVVSIYLQIYYLLSDPASSRLPVVGNAYSSAQPNVASHHNAKFEISLYVVNR